MQVSQNCTQLCHILFTNVNILLKFFTISTVISLFNCVSVTPLQVSHNYSLPKPNTNNTVVSGWKRGSSSAWTVSCQVQLVLWRALLAESRLGFRGQCQWDTLTPTHAYMIPLHFFKRCCFLQQYGSIDLESVLSPSPLGHGNLDAIVCHLTSSFI